MAEPWPGYMRARECVFKCAVWLRVRERPPCSSLRGGGGASFGLILAFL